MYVASVKSSFNVVVLLYDCEQVPVVSVNMLSGLNMLSISFYSLSSLYLFSNKYKRWLGASCDWLFILLLKVPFDALSTRWIEMLKILVSIMHKSTSSVLVYGCIELCSNMR